MLMATFGFFVVVLLLSMVIARFSKTVATVADSIDSNYKLKFAQMTVLYASRLRSSQLAPQPFNLLRRLLLLLSCHCGALLRPSRRVSPAAAPAAPTAAASEASAEASLSAGATAAFPSPSPCFSPRAAATSVPPRRLTLSSADDPSAASQQAEAAHSRPPTALASLAQPSGSKQDMLEHAAQMPSKVERFLERAVCEVGLFPEFVTELLIASDCF